MNSKKPSTLPSILDEPFMSGNHFESDPSEEKAVEILDAAVKTAVQSVEHTVWDEPALSGEFAGAVPETALTYGKWLRGKIDFTSSAKSWIATFLLAIASAPFAIVGVFALHYRAYGGLIVGATAVILGPVLEEMLKIAAALVTIEKRPYLFKTAGQIVITCVLSGLVFAFIENLLYLKIYVPHPTSALILWRWTVCVALHSGCTAISSMGLVKMWRSAVTDLKKPRLPLTTKYIATACVVHGVYNLTAIFLNPFFK
ncbi:MAG: PrsW family intramembrane metalloprotease [Victivallales bacterium]|nr:PrsW family intramembrane metalloprotease [Victivallales bacterium]